MSCFDPKRPALYRVRAWGDVRFEPSRDKTFTDYEDAANYFAAMKLYVRDGVMAAAQWSDRGFMIERVERVK